MAAGRVPLEDALHGRSLLLSPGASSRSQLRMAIAQHHCRIRSYLDLSAATCLWLKPCISPWNWGGPHLALSFGAGRFGGGKGQTCSTRTSCTTCCGQIQGLAFNQTSFWRHVLMFLLFVSFVGSKSAFICWELKGIVLMWSRRDFLLWRQSSRLLLGFSWLQAGCTWPGVRCCWSVPMPAEAPKGALDTGTNSLYKALALIRRLFPAGTENFLLRAASVDEDAFYFHVCHQARQKAWWWCLGTPTGMQALSYPGISRGILLRKNAVGIETDFLNEETNPFPGPGSAPGYPKAICLQIKERLAHLGAL